MYWLTGYDTFGYCFFQCLVLRADGDLVLLTRAPDLRQAQHTSLLEDIRIWVDREGSDPARQLRELLADKGLAGRRLGVEYDSYGLTAANGKRLEVALDGFAAASDASDLIDRLRLIKSAAELAYVRCAAELADAALEAAIAETRDGADEGRILAAMQGAVFEGGGDYPGNPFIIGSGRDALLCRYKTGRRTLDAEDQLTLEFAGVFRQYHACLMRTLLVGAPTPRQRAHARRLPRGAGRRRGRADAGRQDGRGVRGPGRGPRRARHGRASLQRLRLLARHGLRALLDGLADVLRRQPGRDRARHGALPAYDPDGQRGRARDDAGPHLA